MSRGRISPTSDHGDHPACASGLPPAARAVAIVGATAVGKTTIAVQMAEQVGAEIVSLDSRQMVSDLSIGTAKPTSAERERVRHHLIDITEASRPLSLKDVQTAAYVAMADILARRRVPFIVGGTGQFVSAVLGGWAIPAVEPDLELRETLAAFAEQHGVEALHARLETVDPPSAAQIDPRNVRRVIRAIEIHDRTGRPKSEVAGRHGPPCHCLVVGLKRPRPVLYQRIDARIDQMLAAGLEDEVRALVAAGIGFDLPAMSSVGYREWRALLEGGAEQVQVVARIRANTRRLARQQSNWFAADDERILWFDLEERGVREHIEREVRDFLASPTRADEPDMPSGEQ